MYRVRLHPPPFELQTARGLQIAQLSRDTKNETPSRLALAGQSAPRDDIWGSKQPAISYEIRIPASTLLDERDLDAGISYRGQLSIGPPKSNLSGKRRVNWLIKRDYMTSNNARGRGVEVVGAGRGRHGMRILLSTLLLLGQAAPVDTPRLVTPVALMSRAVMDANGNCTGCDLCLAAVGTIELLPRPVLMVIDGAMETAAGVCKQVPGPSGNECYAITSRIAEALDYVLQGCNATRACQAMGACSGARWINGRSGKALAEL